MRILLDTNIIIPLEDSTRALSESFSELSRLALEYGHTLLAHPASRDDINRDSDPNRREISISRLRKYPFLDQAPVLSSEELTKLALPQNNDNDRVDNDMLFAIFKNAANILVSEDRKIHSKADKIGAKDRVHYIQQAVEFLRRLHTKIKITLPNIEEVPLYQLELGSDFFDSLREDYPPFNNWFKKAAREGRKAWIHKNAQGTLGALCIFNIEHDPIITTSNQALPGKVLKLCTFKVGESVRGRRIGELFLKAAFQYATKNEAEHIYLHTNPDKQAFLIDFIREFGFNYVGDYKSDTVYVKKHPAMPISPSSNSPLEYHKIYYPHFVSTPDLGKFIVPIRPEYHSVLFSDNQRQLSLFPFGPGSRFEVVGNAIRQAYICHARIKGIEPGDIILFYRSQDYQAVTSVGIVEQTGVFENVDDIIQLVSKRTVYSHDEIREMAKKKTKVILFRIATHFHDPISFRWLKKNSIVKGNIQTIRKITDESFRKIAHRGEISNCLHAN